MLDLIESSFVHLKNMSETRRNSSSGILALFVMLFFFAYMQRDKEKVLNDGQNTQYKY